MFFFACARRACLREARKIRANNHTTAKSMASRTLSPWGMSPALATA